MSISQIKSFSSAKSQMHSQLQSSPTVINSAIAQSSRTKLAPATQAFNTGLNLNPNHEAPINTNRELQSQVLYNTENWLDTGAKLTTANLDYRDSPSSVGDFVLDPSQSRIQSAIDLGQLPFVTNISTIASAYNIGSSISASYSGDTDTNYIEDLFKEEGEEEKEESKNNLEGLGEEQEKLFKEIDKFQEKENRDLLEIKAKQNPDGPEAKALENQKQERSDENISEVQNQEEQQQQAEGEEEQEEDSQ